MNLSFRKVATLFLSGWIWIFFAFPGHGMEEGSSHAGHGMEMDELGMVMNENLSELPRGCASVVGEESLTIVAGKEFAYSYPGTMFGYDKHEWHVAPCTRLTVTLINRDQVRHQWMIHGFPRYLYPMGMFTIEVNGPGERAATFIVPPGDRTYLVHCDVPHHMEKGMKAQLVVGEGSGDLPSIPGISKPLVFDHYPTNFGASEFVVLVFATVIGAILFYILATRRKTSSSSLSKG